MANYINVEGQKILSYGKQGNIKINSWPSVDGKKARKSECYWDGSQVRLKTNEMLVAEYLESELDKLTDYINKNWLKAAKRTDKIQDKFKEKKDLVYNSMAEIDAAIKEVKADMFTE